MRSHQLLSKDDRKEECRPFGTVHLENVSFAVSEQFKLFVTFPD
jgi:hypothetical protein